MSRTFSPVIGFTPPPFRRFREAAGGGGLSPGYAEGPTIPGWSGPPKKVVSGRAGAFRYFFGVTSSMSSARTRSSGKAVMPASVGAKLTRFMSTIRTRRLRCVW